MVKGSAKKDYLVPETLMQNFVGLQKVLTDLVIKLDSLSNQTGKLLELFETSAKNFVKKNSEGNTDDIKNDDELVNKIDMLLDQNKTIARGLTLVEEKIRHKMYNEGNKRILPMPQNLTRPQELIKSESLTKEDKTKPLPKI